MTIRVCLFYCLRPLYWRRFELNNIDGESPGAPRRMREFETHASARTSEGGRKSQGASEIRAAAWSALKPAQSQFRRAPARGARQDLTRRKQRRVNLLFYFSKVTKLVSLGLDHFHLFFAVFPRSPEVVEFKFFVDGSFWHNLLKKLKNLINDEIYEIYKGVNFAVICSRHDRNNVK